MNAPASSSCATAVSPISSSTRRWPERGVVLGPLDTDHAELLGAVAPSDVDYFTLMNTAFVEAPVLVHVPAGVTVEQADRGAALDRRPAASPSSPARSCTPEPTPTSLSSSTTASTDVAALSVPVVELDVDDAGRLHYLNVQQLAPRVWQIAYQASRVGPRRHPRLLVGGARWRLRPRPHRLRGLGQGRDEQPARCVLRRRREHARLPHHAGPRGAGHDQRPPVQGRGPRQRQVGVLGAHPGAQGGRGHQRLPDQPQPRAVGGGARRVGAQPGDRGQRRALQPRVRGRADRRGAALLPREPGHRARRGRAADRARASSARCSTGCPSPPLRRSRCGRQRWHDQARAKRRRAAREPERPTRTVYVPVRSTSWSRARPAASRSAPTASAWCASATTSTPSATVAATPTSRSRRARSGSRSARSSAGSTAARSRSSTASRSRCRPPEPVPVYDVIVEGDDVLVKIS